jgi:uncharacterized protein YdaU (DUF1376 family)
MNYYPFNVGDYAAHTAHLEPMEDLAYRRLLDLYYLSEKPLPSDVQVTAKLIRMRSCAGDVESVLNEFFTLTDDGWRHARCDSEICRMQDKQAKARASAHASVNARRANAERSLPNDQANAERTLPKKTADVELPTPTPTPNTSMRRGARLPEDWAPSDEDMGFAKHLLNGRSEVEVSKFRDYWTAKPGKDGVKLDWSATWRNWCRTAAERAGKSPASTSGSIFDGAL